MTNLLRPAAGTTKPKGKIYIRVSDLAGREEGELFSPEIQERAARTKAKQEGIEILDVVVDLDITGRKFDDRKIRTMIAEIKRGEYEYIVLWKWSRFGRNLKQSLIHLDELKAAGGMALSATEPGDGETMMGKFSRNQMLLLAELQSDMIGEGWKEARELRLSKGLPPHGKIGYGYRFREEPAPTPTNPNKTIKIIEIDPETGPIIKEVFERFLDDEPLKSIVFDMTSRGVRTKVGALITNDRWIRYMDTGFAAGLIRTKLPGTGTSTRFDCYEWHPGAHTALITDEQWDQYSARRKASMGKKWFDWKAKYSVSGLLVCSRCKLRMASGGRVDGPNSKTVLFKCTTALSGLCKGVAVRSTVIEQAVLQWLRQRAHLITSDEEASRRLALDHQVTDEAEQLEKQIAKLEGRIARIKDMYEEDEISKPEFLERKAAREQELTTAEHRLAEIHRRTSQRLPASFYMNLEQAWGSLSEDRRRQGLKKVIDFIVVHPRGREGSRFEVVPYETLEGETA